MTTLLAKDDECLATGQMRGMRMGDEPSLQRLRSFIHVGTWLNKEGDIWFLLEILAS